MKYIYCIEGNWNNHPKSRLSIRPILELLDTFYGIKYIHRRCLTKDDFFEALHDYITLNVPPVALSIVPLQKWSLSVRQSYDYF